MAEAEGELSAAGWSGRTGQVSVEKTGRNGVAVRIESNEERTDVLDTFQSVGVGWRPRRGEEEEEGLDV